MNHGPHPDYRKAETEIEWRAAAASIRIRFVSAVLRPLLFIRAHPN